MHISEGVLSARVLTAGALLGVGGLIIGLKKMNRRRIPEVAVLSSAFFVASLIRIPLGPASAHLSLNGLIGILIGWCSFPSIFIALFLQAVLFQFGGLTTLGINTLNMALPAVAVHYIFGPSVRRGGPFVLALSGFLAGASAVALSTALIALSLIGSERAFTGPSAWVALTHVPVLFLEGAVTAFCLAFLRKVKPEVLGAET